MAEDKKENLIFIEELLDGSSFVPNVLDEYSDLLKKGWAGPRIPFKDFHRILARVTPETRELQGAVVYTINKPAKTLWKIFSFTLEKHRRSGVFTSLDTELRRLAKIEDCRDIQTFVHPDNEAMLNANKKQGMVIEFLRMHVNIKPR
jgi:hypothetical protein